MYMFMSGPRKKLLAESMLEMLEHSNDTVKTAAMDVLQQSIKRSIQAVGTPLTTKEVILTMAPIIEMAEEHQEKVLAHDLAGCD
jgi:hypothetical protein